MWRPRPRAGAAWLLAGCACTAALAASVGGERALPPGGEAPAPGDFDATLCVAVAAAPPDCGPVSARVDAAGRTVVRISDIVYLLQMYGEQLGITMFHGAMQVDGFFAPYRWRGLELEFVDVEKNTRYELRLGAPRAPAR